MATQPINGYVGSCRLQVTSTAIIVSTNGNELATWLYNCIRQFNAIDCFFSFTSGRRGPFGVGEYCFELPQKKVLEIQKKISSYTGAVFGHSQTYNNNSLIASTSVSNPSRSVAPVSDRTRSESETIESSAAVSSNLYPLTSLSNSQTYQNTGFKRVVAPPIPSKDPVKTITLQNDQPQAQYVNAMNGSPKPLPRTMKPSLQKSGLSGAAKPLTQPTYNATSLPHANGSTTLPTHSKTSQGIVMSTKPVLNPVGSHSDLNTDPLLYGDQLCSPHGPDTKHNFFSVTNSSSPPSAVSSSPPSAVSSSPPSAVSSSPPSAVPSSATSLSPPPAINCGYSEVDYDVIRRNRETGKFADPQGAYSSNHGNELPSSMPVSEGTYDVPRTTGGKFENVPDVYEDDRRQVLSNDLSCVPNSNQRVTSELYDVPPSRGVVDSQTLPTRHKQIYDNPSLPSRPLLSKVVDDPGNSSHDLYDVPQSNQLALGSRETYDVVPSRRTLSSSPQPQMTSSSSKKSGYVNIGPNGEILGEAVANTLRRELFDSLGKPSRFKLSRSCEFLNEVGLGPTKRFSSSVSYRKLIMPEQENVKGGTSSHRTSGLHRKSSGSLGDLPVVQGSDDDDDDNTYVTLNKIEKPVISKRKPPVPAPKPVATSNGVGDDVESDDMYVAMNRSPIRGGTSTADTESLPKGYIRMNVAKETLMKSSISNGNLGEKMETSPTSNKRRSSDLVWPSNSSWSQWNPLNEQTSRKSSDTSEVFSPPPADDDHPIVVSKSSVQPKRSILLKKVSPQPASGHQEKRSSK